MHSLNVPGLRCHIWPGDGSFEPKHVAVFLHLSLYTLLCYWKRQISAVKDPEWSRGFQETKVPRFRDKGAGWW